MWFRALSVIVLACAMLAGARFAAAQSLAEQLEWSRTVARAELALAQDPQLRPYALRLRASGTTLTLTGRVSSSDLRQRASDVVRDATGGGRIDNRLEVGSSDAARVPLPPRIRRDAAREERPQPAEDAAERTPERQREQPQTEAVYHTVRSGDTLIAIARRHGTTVSEIQRLNNLRGTNIRPGQRLRVR